MKRGESPNPKCHIPIIKEVIKIIDTKKFGKAEIIGNGSKYNYVKVKFLNTGNIDEFRIDAVKRGEIRDKWAVTLCGIGIIGNIKTRGKYKKYYTLWRNMITRCYTDHNKAYKNVTVCERWKVFQYFYEDIPLIENWDKEKFENGDIDLDKDTKQRFSDNKIYSLETCCWVDQNVNRQIQDGQQNNFVAYDPDGNEYFGNNITAFGREHGLERKQISAVLHGRFKSTNGWKFKFIGKEIV